VADSTKTLTILGKSRPLLFKEHVNVLEILNVNKISIGQSCGGNGTCTTCRFFVLNGADNLSKRTELELERSAERNFKSNERLACQTEIFGSIEIEIPEED
jgi:ferredoxin, 2Fe-2S